MKIGFISYHKKNNKLAWSGTNYYLYTTLNKKYNVSYIHINGFLAKGLRLFFRFFKLYDFAELVHSYLFGLELDLKIFNKKYDYLFACECNDIIAYTHTKTKIISLLDVTYNLYFDYYKHKYILKEKNRLINNDKLAFEKTRILILASNWVKKDCISFYRFDDKKIHILKFGANITCNIKSNIRVIDKVVYLLFVGVEFDRKGLDVVMNATNYLNHNDNNHKYVLNVVGINRNEIDNNIDKILNKNYDEYCKIYGKLYKNLKNDLNKMINLYIKSNLFVLPTKAECAGIVFSESSMFGLPSITRDTGGVKDYVEDDVNGYTLPLNANFIDFANKILDIVYDDDLYKKLQFYSIKKYNQELNWDKWRNDFDKVVDLYDK